MPRRCGFGYRLRPRILVAARELGPHSNAGPDAARENPSQRVYAVCATDFNADGKLDLLVGDHYYFTRDLDDEQRAAYRASTRRRSEFWDEFRETILFDAADEPRAERVERFQGALEDWDLLSSLLWVGGQASQSGMERHGGPVGAGQEARNNVSRGERNFTPALRPQR